MQYALNAWQGVHLIVTLSHHTDMSCQAAAGNCIHFEVNPRDVREVCVCVCVALMEWMRQVGGNRVCVWLSSDTRKWASIFRQERTRGNVFVWDVAGEGRGHVRGNEGGMGVMKVCKGKGHLWFQCNNPIWIEPQRHSSQANDYPRRKNSHRMVMGERERESLKRLQKFTL